ncbi:MAG: hypothetical protein V1773_12020 [bacterium]
MGLLSKSKKEFEALIQENEELKSRLNKSLEMVSSFEDLEYKVINARKEIAELNQQEFESANRLRDLENDINKKKHLFTDLNSKIKTLESSELTLNDSVEKLLKEKNEAEQTYNAKLKMFEEIGSKGSDITLDIEQKELELKELNESIESSKKDKNYLVEEIISLQENVINLREEHKEIDTNYGSIKEEFNTLTTNVNELRTRLTAYTNELRDVELTIVQKRDIENKLEKKLDTLIKEEKEKSIFVKELDERILLNEEIKQNIEEGLSGLIKQLAEKDLLFDEYSSKKDEIASQIIEKRKELANIEVLITQNSGNYQQLEKQSSNLASSIDKLNTELENKTAINHNIEQSILQKRQEEEFRITQLNEIKAKINDIEKFKFDIEQNYLQLESKLSETLTLFNEEITEAKIKLNLLKQHILDREIEISAKDKLLNEKRIKISEIEGNISILIKEKESYDGIVNNLKNTRTEHELQIEKLKAAEFNQKAYLNDTINQLTTTENKKAEVELNIKQLLDMQSKTYTAFEERNSLAVTELKENELKLKDITEKISTESSKLAELKNEMLQFEIKKEEYSSKIAQLISLENSMELKTSATLDKTELED